MMPKYRNRNGNDSSIHARRESAATTSRLLKSQEYRFSSTGGDSRTAVAFLRTRRHGIIFTPSLPGSSRRDGVDFDGTAHGPDRSPSDRFARVLTSPLQR